MGCEPLALLTTGGAPGGAPPFRMPEDGSVGAGASRWTGSRHLPEQGLESGLRAGQGIAPSILAAVVDLWARSNAETMGRCRLPWCRQSTVLV